MITVSDYRPAAGAAQERREMRSEKGRSSKRETRLPGEAGFLSDRGFQSRQTIRCQLPEWGERPLRARPAPAFPWGEVSAIAGMAAAGLAAGAMLGGWAGILALGGLSIYGVILGGWASGNK